MYRHSVWIIPLDVICIWISQEIYCQWFFDFFFFAQPPCFPVNSHSQLTMSLLHLPFSLLLRDMPFAFFLLLHLSLVQMYLAVPLLQTISLSVGLILLGRCCISWWDDFYETRLSPVEMAVDFSDTRLSARCTSIQVASLRRISLPLIQLLWEASPVHVAPVTSFSCSDVHISVLSELSCDMSPFPVQMASVKWHLSCTLEMAPVKSQISPVLWRWLLWNDTSLLYSGDGFCEIHISHVEIVHWRCTPALLRQLLWDAPLSCWGGWCEIPISPVEVADVRCPSLLFSCHLWDTPPIFWDGLCETYLFFWDGSCASVRLVSLSRWHASCSLYVFTLMTCVQKTEGVTFCPRSFCFVFVVVFCLLLTVKHNKLCSWP